MTAATSHRPRLPRRRHPAPRAMLAALAMAGVLSASACGSAGHDGDGASDKGSDAATAWVWTLPAGFPVPAVPAANPMSAARVELGRHLFHDPRLSGNGGQACSSCHQRARAFTDGFDAPRGVTGRRHPRNTQGLVNVVYSPTLTWADPRPRSLEEQMLTPLFGTDPIEMGVNDENREAVLARIAAVPDYVERFQTVWGKDDAGVTWERIIAAFQRTIISADSRYDRFLAGRATLTSAEQRGRALFFGDRAGCSQCHGGIHFNDQVVHADGGTAAPLPFHHTGLYNLDGAGAYPAPNRGIFEFTGDPGDMGRFRAPSLRNVALTRPYMHDGSIPTLEAVLAFYADGGRVITSGPLAGDGRTSPLRSERLRHSALGAAEQDDLVAFLHTLTDTTLLANPAFADPFATAANP